MIPGDPLANAVVFGLIVVLIFAIVVVARRPLPPDTSGDNRTFRKRAWDRKWYMLVLLAFFGFLWWGTDEIPRVDALIETSRPVVERIYRPRPVPLKTTDFDISVVGAGSERVRTDEVARALSQERLPYPVVLRINLVDPLFFSSQPPIMSPWGMYVPGWIERHYDIPLTMAGLFEPGVEKIYVDDTLDGEKVNKVLARELCRMLLRLRDGDKGNGTPAEVDAKPLIVSMWESKEGWPVAVCARDLAVRYQFVR